LTFLNLTLGSCCVLGIKSLYYGRVSMILSKHGLFFSLLVLSFIGSGSFASLLPLSEMSEDRYVDVNIWTRGHLLKDLTLEKGGGHVSLTIRDRDPRTGMTREIYSSLWPKETAAVHAVRSFKKSVESLWHLPSDDETGEGRHPDQIIRIYSLDTRAIYNVFDTKIRAGNMRYKLASALPGYSDTAHSCASWAVELLQNGGAKNIFQRQKDSEFGALKVISTRVLGGVITGGGIGFAVGAAASAGVFAVPGAFFGAVGGVLTSFTRGGFHRDLAKVEDGHEAFSFYQITPGDVLALASEFSTLEKRIFTSTHTWARDVTGRWDMSSGSVLDRALVNMERELPAKSVGRVRRTSR
jgi:hypothetical protein